MLACIIIIFLKLLGWLFFGFFSRLHRLSILISRNWVLGWLFFGIFFQIAQVININIKKLGVGLFIRKFWVITVGYA
jgi:hypothetical protein